MATLAPEVKSRLRSLNVGVVSAAALVAVVAAVATIGVLRSGSFSYPLDDPYIHLVLAKNLAEYGTLGVNPGQFASATSSPLWPLVIAVVVWCAGPLIGIPVILATLIGAAVVIGLDRWALAQHFTVGERCAVQLLFLVAVPLPMMALTGMEHTLQVGTCFLLVTVTIDAASREGPSAAGLRSGSVLAGASFLAAAVRYETVFVLIPLGVLLLYRRCWASALSMVIGAAVPVLIVAMVNLAHGWPALPTSVLVKTVAERGPLSISRFLPDPSALAQFAHTYRLVAMVGVTVLLWAYGRWSRGRAWSARADQWSAVAIVATFAHVCYSQLGWLYRYEAYLVALCIGASAVSAHALLTSESIRNARPAWPRLTGLAAGVLVLIALADGVRILPAVNAGMAEISAQQVQMAAFAATACPGCTVAANDIGAIAMYGNGRVFDDFGLANNDVLEEKLADDWTTERLNALATEVGASLAMVYTEKKWIPGVPSSWVPLGSWTLRNARIVGQATVRFYSLDAARTSQLRQALADFPPPPRTNVIVER